MLRHARSPHERGNGVVFFKSGDGRAWPTPALKVLTGTLLSALILAAGLLSWRLWP
jgi:hypothetical protein